jgi:hypothetical protein
MLRTVNIVNFYEIIEKTYPQVIHILLIIIHNYFNIKFVTYICCTYSLYFIFFISTYIKNLYKSFDHMFFGEQHPTNI